MIPSFVHADGKSSKSIVEQAERSGELYLSNRKIKDLKICVADHDLSDVTVVDCSCNSLTEIPPELCEWFCIDSLNLSHNLIKNIPEFLRALCLIEVLDLSNNLITHLPSSLCELDALTSLHLQNNKVVSLPSAIGKLANCQMLNISGNELNSLPPEIGNMLSLKHLDVSRNSLSSLPEELSELELVYLDASCNNISSIPPSYQNMQMLQVAIFDHNPLTFPPLSMLKKGRVHMFKSLQGQSSKNQKHQESLEPILTRRRVLSKKVDYSLTEVMENMYAENVNKHSISLLTNDPVKTKDLSPAEYHTEVPLDKEVKVIKEVITTDVPTVNGTQTDIDGVDTSRVISEDIKNKSPTKAMNEISDLYEKDISSKSNGESPTELQDGIPAEKIESPVKFNDKRHAQNIESPVADENESSAKADESPLKVKNKSPAKTTESPVKVKNKSPAKTTESPVKSKNENSVEDVGKHEIANKTKDENEIKSPALTIKSSVLRPDIPSINLKPKPISFPGYTPAPPIKQKPKRKSISHLLQDNPDKAHYLEVIKPRTAVLNRRKPSNSESDLSFTMRRKTEKIYEELELLEELRGSIESALKMPLPQDLLPALTDGVVLCHLANHVKSRSIPTIHVPSPAVPKLSLAKCRRNADNFLEACVKLGVANSRLCTPNDIMQGKGLSRIVSTVNDLLKPAKENPAKAEPTFSAPSVRIAASSFVKQRSHLYNN